MPEEFPDPFIAWALWKKRTKAIKTITGIGRTEKSRLSGGWMLNKSIPKNILFLF
jgi:hypothetical protein